MIDDEKVKHATEEVLAELNLGEERFEIEPALASPHAETRQIRLFDASGNDRGAVVVDFQDADGNVSETDDDIKARIRKQLETLKKISG